MMMKQGLRVAVRVAGRFRTGLQKRSLGQLAFEGEDIPLNWSLVGDDITPMGNAYRNLKPRALIQSATGSLGPNKSLVVAPGSPAEGSPASQEVVTHALSNVDDVFVVDAAVGSFRGSEVMVRAVTDDASLALFLSHLLVKTGGSSTASSGEYHPIKVFHSSQGNVGLSTSVSDANATIVASGNIAFEEIKEAITAATHTLMAKGEDEFDVLPLPGNVFVNSSGQTIVEIGSTDGAVNKVDKKHNLHGAHGSVWSQAGIARLFGGAVLDNGIKSPIAGDLVVDNVVITALRADNLIDHPSKIIFSGVGKKKSSTTDLFAKVARSDEEVSKFTALVEKHNVEVSSK